jgi:Large polyvalent protein-associated domain 1
MGAKKLNDWFYQLPEDKQIEYCSRLKGKKNSKYCTIEGTPKHTSFSQSVVEKVKYVPDSEGQMTMNFGFEEDLKKSGVDLSLVVNKEKTDAATDEIEAIVEQDSTITEKEHEYYDRESDYEWAKKSEVENIGEDIEGSARHQRNSHKDWNSEDAFTNLDMKVNKALLEEENSIDFEDVSDLDLPKAYVISLCMDEYPSTLPLEKGLETNEVKLARRKSYIDTYNQMVDKGEELLNNPAITPQEALKEMSELVRAKFKEHKANGDTLMANAMAKKFNRMISGKNGPWDQLCSSYKTLSETQPENFPHKSVWMKPNFNSTEARSKLVGNDDARTMYKNLISGAESLKPKRKIKKTGFEERGIYAENKEYKIDGNKYKIKSDTDAVAFFKANSRAVQFGNALPDQERKDHLVSCAKSIEDLSSLTGLRFKDLTQNGKLAFSFSARGGAGAAAHYERGSKVINLTRDSGFGSLAHELGHALDNHANSKMGGSSADYLSDSTSGPLLGVAQTLKKLRSRIEKTAQYRSMNPKQRQYWTSNREMFARLFEAYVDKKAQKANLKNSYLVQLPVRENLRQLWPDDSELAEVEHSLESFFEDYKKTNS